MDKHMRRVNERENVRASIADTETALQGLDESFAGHRLLESLEPLVKITGV